MDIATLRDWIIVVVGVLGIIFFVTAFIMAIVVYKRLNRLMTRIECIVTLIEKLTGIPFTFLSRLVSKGRTIFSRPKKEEKTPAPKPAA